MDYLGDLLKLMALAEAQKSRMKRSTIHKTDIIGDVLTTVDTKDHTYIVPQEILICSDELLDMVTNSEWTLLRKILKELHINNCLWYCGPEYKKTSSTINGAIRGLISKNIIWKTYQNHYYLVNPLYLRKGNMVFNLITTSQAIYNNKGIDEMLLRPLKQLKQFKFNGDIASELSNPITQAIVISNQNDLYKPDFGPEM